MYDQLELEYEDSAPISAKDSAPADLIEGFRELQVALPAYEKAEAYYRGTIGELYSSPRIARVLAYTDNRYRVNFAKTPVDVVADRLEISSVTVPANDKMTLVLSSLYRKARLHRKSRTVHHRVSEYGDAYMFAWPAEDSTLENPVFDIYYNNPKTTRAIYDSSNPDEVRFFIKCWRAVGPLSNSEQKKVWYVTLYYKDQFVKYVQKLDADPNRASSWSEVDVLPNPYGQFPIFHFRNEDPFGCPEHYAAYGAQDAINKLSTTLVHTSEYQGFPQRYGLAMPNAAIAGDSTDNSMWDDEATPSPQGNKDSDLEGGPGTFLRLEGIAAAGSFPAAQSSAFLDPLQFYIRAMAQVTTTPIRFFFSIGEPPSGESLRAADAPLIKKVTDRQDAYEETWEDLYQFALFTLTEEEFIVDIQWAPAASIDDAAGWDTIRLKVNTGVPLHVALVEAGYPRETVDEWVRSNETKTLSQGSAQSMASLAAAARDLSTAVEAGIIEQGYASQILRDLINAVVPNPENSDNTGGTDGEAADQDDNSVS